MQRLSPFFLGGAFYFFFVLAISCVGQGDIEDAKTQVLGHRADVSNVLFVPIYVRQKADRLYHDLKSKNEIRNIMIIDPKTQFLFYFKGDDNLVRSYPVSTAKNGIGSVYGSEKTPPGLHYISDKFGAQEPLGRVFVHRIPTQQIMTGSETTEADHITSRILWLKGLEPGINLGGNVDSYQRGIYLHGTSDELGIGSRRSRGCIRLRNRDIIELFDDVRIGDYVEVLHETL